MDHMLKFKASAPGKVILHGEHSVVHNKPALATTIGIRTNLNCNENNSSLINFNFENLNTKFSLSLDEANNFIENIKIDIDSETDDIYLKVKNFIEFFYKNEIHDKSTQMAALSAFFLLSHIFLSTKNYKLRNGFDINLKSDIKIGAGLGSSASFNVCLAASFLVLSRQIEIRKNASLTLEDKALIVDWSLKSEKIMHSNPSGVDNTVCTFGNIIRFLKGQNFQEINMKFKLNILLVDTKVTRNTAKIVLKIAEMKKQFPNITNSILNAMEEVVLVAITTYEEYKSDNINDFKKLQWLFQINNDLLKTLGASHPKLEEIFCTSSKYGYSSKLTGAGGGGFAIILLPDNYKNHPNYSKLCNDLKAQDFDFIDTTIGGAGITLELI